MLQQLVIHRLRRVLIAVDEDIAAPIRPELLPRRERVEPAGIHVANAVFLRKIRKIPLEPLAAADTCPAPPETPHPQAQAA